jgi:transposase InsO family protein
MFRWHADLMGPMPIQEDDGLRYLLCILDYFSRFCMVVPLELKSDAKTKIQQLKIRMEVQTEKRPAKFRSDQGGEFDNHELATFFVDRRVEAEFSPARTPMSNGSAERLIGVLQPKARVTMFAQNMSGELWPEMYKSIAHLRNRTPCEAIDMELPYQLFWDHEYIAACVAAVESASA